MMEESGTELRDIALGQKKIIYLILISLLLTLPLLIFQSSIPFSKIILTVISWTVSIIGAFLMYGLAIALGLKWPSLWIVGSFVPWLNYGLLMIVNHKATMKLRAKGIEVGFLGVKNIGALAVENESR